MKSFVVILAVVNVLVFGLAQGWFGTVRSDQGRNPALLENQLNADAVIVSRGEIQQRESSVSGG